MVEPHINRQSQHFNGLFSGHGFLALRCKSVVILFTVIQEPIPKNVIERKIWKNEDRNTQQVM